MREIELLSFSSKSAKERRVVPHKVGGSRHPSAGHAAEVSHLKACGPGHSLQGVTPDRPVAEMLFAAITCSSRARPAILRLAAYSATRRIVSASIPVPNDVSMERPEAVALVESEIYRDSWAESASRFFPGAGMHFTQVDLFSNQLREKNKRSAPTLGKLEQTLAQDLSSTAYGYCIVIARGPIQCLLSQYFVESLPLAGLVLVDPLLLPDDGRINQPGVGCAQTRWSSSLSDLVSILDRSSANSPMRNSSQITDDMQSEQNEIHLIRSLKIDKGRAIKLEPQAVPTLVMYSGGHEYEDHFRICAERTASFHTSVADGDFFDQVPVVKVKDDAPHMQTILDWYDESAT